MTRYFSVKNYERFQHYKDRTPPWIKFYNDVLDDYEFGRLHDASKAHLCAIWLLASRNDNRIPYDPEWIGKRINATEPVDLQCLLDAGFIILEQDCSAAQAQPEQDASTALGQRERERERQSSVSNETDADASPDLKTHLFNGCLDWLSKQSGKPSDKLRPQMGRWVKEHGEGAVLDAVTQAQTTAAIDPVAFINGCLGGKRDWSKYDVSD